MYDVSHLNLYAFPYLYCSHKSANTMGKYVHYYGKLNDRQIYIHNARLGTISFLLFIQAALLLEKHPYRSISILQGF